MSTIAENENRMELLCKPTDDKSQETCRGWLLAMKRFLLLPGDKGEAGIGRTRTGNGGIAGVEPNNGDSKGAVSPPANGNLLGDESSMSSPELNTSNMVAEIAAAENFLLAAPPPDPGRFKLATGGIRP
jgi:hypothetical protein